MFSSPNSNLEHQQTKQPLPKRPQICSLEPLLVLIGRAGYLCHIGEKVIWYSLWVLTDLSWDVSTDGVEVPEQHCVPVLEEELD